jgi:hypothetical protein
VLLRLLNINMGSFVFKWEHAASEVYVTGTFDNWSKSEKLIQTGDVFEKNVTLPSAAETIYYKVRGVTMNCYKLFQRVELRHQVGREGLEIPSRENASLWNATGLYLEMVRRTLAPLLRV